MTNEMGLFFSAIAFVGLHFLLSHPLRDPLVRAVGEGPFRGIYALLALLTFGTMIHYYSAIGDEPQLYVANDAVWVAASLLMWFGAILFIGSFIGNPALPGARVKAGARPGGVFAITRHPMMWGFAIWAIVHLVVVAMPKSLVFDGAILFLALAGSAGQDAKKRKLMGERWHEWVAHTAFIPFARGVASPGAVALIGGTLLFFIATWAHGAIGGMPAGFWRWIG